MKRFVSILAVLLLAITNLLNAQPTQTAAPILGNVNNCTNIGIDGIPLDECPANANNFRSNFRNGVYNRGNSSNYLAPGAVWRFTNVGLIGTTPINAEVQINGMLNATLANSGSGANNSSTARLEDDNALDQDNKSIADFFAPKIGPSASLSTADRQGYVDFTIFFFNGSAGNGFTAPFNINNLNYVHYDIDGGFQANNPITGAWFRETGVALQDKTENKKFAVTVTNVTELVQYMYEDNGDDWSGFAGTVFERTGVSRCAQTAVSYRYTSARSSVRFRMGYSYKGKSGFSWGTGARQYGATFGCYAFPAAITLPVKLNDFSGYFQPTQATLSWSAQLEENFSHYEVERSDDGVTFKTVGIVFGVTDNNMKKSYQFVDQLSSVEGKQFFYRLKMVDNDTRFTYSKTIIIKKDAKQIEGIVLSPNPVTGGNATIRFTASTVGSVTIRVMDMTGNTILRQQSKVFAGNNSVAINDLQNLRAGVYMLQVFNGDNQESIKFTISK